MGVLGTMVVNFTANVQGIQPGVRNISPEEMQEDFTQGMQALIAKTIADGITASNIAMVSNGILDIAKEEDDIA